MRDIYHFESLDHSIKDFYLHFKEDSVLYFEEKERTLLGALDIYKYLVKGQINLLTMKVNKIDINTFINTYILDKYKDNIVVIEKNKLSYHDYKKFMYVDINQYDVKVDYDINVTVRYEVKDSDRHSEKDKLHLHMSSGIQVYNNKYLLYVCDTLLRKFKIRKVV